MNLGQLLDQGLSFIKVTKENADSDYRRWCIEALNELQRTAMTQCEPPWGIREVKLITATAFSGGAASLANGSTLVTEAVAGGTGWTDSLRGRKFVAANRLEWYELVEFLSGSPSAWRIDPPYQGSTDTSSTYGIYQDEIDLPTDFRAMVSVRNELVPRRLQYRDAWLQDHKIPRTFWSSTSNNFAPYVATLVTRERRPVTWSTTGTLALSFASDRVTFSSLGSTSAMDDLRYRGCGVRMSGTTTVIQLRQMLSSVTAGGVTTATGLMYEPWRGGSLINTGYELVPKGQYRLSLWPVPNTVTVIQARYFFHPEPMVNFEDVPVLPVQHHDYLWLGLAYRMSALSGAPDAQPQRETLYRDWKESEVRMLHALSPNEDSIVSRSRFGKPAWPSWDGPLLPDNFPAQWASAGVGDDQPWPT